MNLVNYTCVKRKQHKTSYRSVKIQTTQNNEVETYGDETNININKHSGTHIMVRNDLNLPTKWRSLWVKIVMNANQIINKLMIYV